MPPPHLSTSALLQGVLDLLQGALGSHDAGASGSQPCITMGLQRIENASFVVMFDHFSFHIASCTSRAAEVDICRVQGHQGTRAQITMSPGSPRYQGTRAHAADRC